MIRRIVPIFMDTEVVHGRSIGELGLLNARNGQTFSIRMRTGEGQEEQPTFIDGWRRGVDWIQQQKQEGDTVVLIGHNIDRHDIKKVREQFLANIRATHETELERLWPEFLTFDTHPLSKKVHPVKRVHNLAALRHKYRVPYDEGGAHRALSDCIVNKAVLEKMAYGVPMEELYPLMALSDGVAQVAQRILAAQQIIPVFVDCTLSAPVKEDKFDEGRLPHIVRLEAVSPLTPNDLFSTCVRLPENPYFEASAAEGLTKRKLQGKKLPDFPVAFKSFKRWVRERLPGTNHRAALIAWDAWDRDGLVFKTEAERHGKTVPHHWTWFSLSYAQKCVVRGFWDRVPEGTRDGTVGQLLNHYHITPSGCNVRDLAALYQCLLGYADQRELLKAMFEFPSVKPVAQVALSAQQAEPVFFDLETTGLIEYLRREDNPRYYVKDEKGNKIVSRMPEITQISAFFPTRLEKVTDMELPPVAVGATEYSFAGLPQDLLPLHPGSVTLRIGSREFGGDAIGIDYATGRFTLTIQEPSQAKSLSLTFTHEAKAWFNQYVRPEVPITPEAEEITGITLDPDKPLKDRRFVCVSGCPTFKEVAPLFFAKIFEGVTPGKRPVLIAHNCWYFDKLVLENMCAKVGLEVKDLSWFDTLFLAAKIFGGGIRGNGINDLCNHYGIVQREGHKADSDVAAMYGITKKMFEGCDHPALYKLMLEKKSLDVVYAEIRRHRPLPEFTCEEDEN